MDLGLTDVQRDIRDTARSFIAKEVMPLENEVLQRERRGEKGITRAELRDLQARARRFGFWGIGTPAEHGGADLPPVTQSLIWTEVGRTYVPFLFGGEADNILFRANAEQQAEYLMPTIEGERISCFAITEPEAGSDATAIRMRAVRDGDDWVLNGEKTFITGGVEADFSIVVAVTDPDLGHRGGHTAFLVDRSMGWTADPIHTMGPSTPASMGFVDVRVPNRNVLGEVGEGFRLAMEWIGRGRYVIPSRAIGATERLLGMAVQYANERKTFGVLIREHGQIQRHIAESYAEFNAARCYVYDVARRFDLHSFGNRVDADAAKLFAARVGKEIADRAIQVLGGYGYMGEYV
ncbi:MAG TPA: acyl-CoA dehydrogenase, partial [Conexibacter sp.]|nr:acyl-CoA dehydrogenase [Conexibacter sp.]